ncbi:MAG: AbrB/MazE/SpoVT family DNA-binding domain-containing protein [Clostridia bacterium]|nr:AbrB/MazE/SpoVT family DNA-binding domain-containing protein [Clostridia bacterium]
MKATGIVRRIDDLGRVVIPKEIRRTMRIREGDPLEIYTDRDGEVIFKKYSPMGEFSLFAAQLCETLHKTSGYASAVCDRDTVIAVSGPVRRETAERRLSEETMRVCEERQLYCWREGEEKLPVVAGADGCFAALIAPIISGGDVAGAVVFLGTEGTPAPGETEAKLAQTVAGFLSRQMED